MPRFRPLMTAFFLLEIALSVPTLFAEEAKKVDGQTPQLLTGFAPCAEQVADDGGLLLLDGKTFFGWTAEPLKPMVRVGKPSPVIEMKEGVTRIETVVPIRIMTDLYFPRPWRIELTYHTEGEINAYVEVHDTAKNSMLKRFSGALVETAESKTMIIEAYGERGDPIQFDGQNITETGTVQGHSGLWIFVRSGALTIEKLAFYPKTTPLFASLDSGWKVLGETRAQVEEVDGDSAIHLSGGKGALETLEEFDDFFLQLEYKELASQNNSGLFFRTIPGSDMDGYEAQLCDDPLEENREKFLGNDTGSIFRQAAARRVVEQSREWNHLTIMAEGDFFRTWVNGIPTVIWTDTRKGDPNPRKGRRFKRGTIQLQGHEPSTDILFKNFQVISPKTWSIFGYPEGFVKDNGG